MRNYKHVLWNEDEDGDGDNDGGRVERKLYGKERPIYSKLHIQPSPLYRNQRRIVSMLIKVGDGMESRGG